MQNNKEAVKNENLGCQPASSEQGEKHPRFILAEVVGTCPECGDSVFALNHSLSCVEALRGNCSFILDRSQLERHAMPEGGIPDLIQNGEFVYELCSADMAIDYRAELALLDGCGWHVAFIGRTIN